MTEYVIYCQDPSTMRFGIWIGALWHYHCTRPFARERCNESVWIVPDRDYPEANE